MKLLLVSALLLVLSTLTADGAAVLDISGNALKRGTPYYIISAIGGAGGGGLFPLMRPRICPRCRFCCPLNVAQKWSDLDKGHPVIVSPSDSSEEVQLLTDVKIEFTVHVPYDGSPIWKLDKADSNGNRYVTLNGDPNNSIDTFKIEKMGMIGYKLLYCPSVAGTVTDSACGSLGISVESANRSLVLSDQPFGVVLHRWLVLSDQPFGVVFVKA